MKPGNSENKMKDMEHRAEEFMSFTIEVCEEHLEYGRAPLTPPQKALAAAALGVRQSISTFLAVSKIPGKEGREE
jgi:hypothetical protein